MKKSHKVWGVHMDISVGTDPVDNGYVSIGWSELGNLSAIGGDRSAFKAAILEKLPESKPGSIPVQAGVLYRFLHVMKEGDIVIYPSKTDKIVNIGKVCGPYKYSPKTNSVYPNIRPIKWIKHFSRDEFSQAALYEIGSFITLFSVRNYANEFLVKLGGKQLAIKLDEIEELQDDDTVTQTASKRAEESTHDFIIRQLKTGINPYEFESFTAHLLECMGYHARVTAKSGDGGVDVIAHKDHLGFEPPIIKVQCKQVTKTIGRPEVTQLLGNIESGEHGLFVCLGSFTRDARQLARSKPNLRLISGEGLVELIFEHYPKFSPRYQTLLPLKQIYVPSLKDFIA